MRIRNPVALLPDATYCLIAPDACQRRRGGQLKSILILVLAITTSALFGQSNSSDAQGEQTTAKSGSAAALLQHLAQVKQRHEQRLQESKTNIIKMRGALDQMRADTANIKDVAAKSVALSNIGLWQMTLDNMQKNVDASDEMTKRRDEIMRLRQKQRRESQDEPSEPK